jgi:type IV pilus assembly protein PilE
MRTTLPGQARRSRGFTLIELMMVVAVVAILAAVALPSFLDSIRKGRRSEAFAAISALQQAQERWRSNKATYGDNTELSVTSPTRPSGYYTIGITGNTATGYVVTATAASGTTQVNDGACAQLSLKVDSGNLSYASCASCAVAGMTYANTNACWN